jgi:chemotaxis protein MotB
MARKRRQEDRFNHEAWAIPYGDLITLLLAFFVVMYSMSSINEGKYRVLSDSLAAAFQGARKTMVPINVGQERGNKGGDAPLQGVSPTMLLKLPNVRPFPEAETSSRTRAQPITAIPPLMRMAQDVRQAMQKLIDRKEVVVRQEPLWLEVEIRTDILFPSGVSSIAPNAVAVLEELAGILKPFPNPVRVEGHTDNRPINTRAFPSNWELSAARAASVVHLFTQAGIDPQRLEIIGLGEHRPIATNDTAEGRNTNRRVRIVILDNENVVTRALEPAALPTLLAAPNQP